jgi:branched-chain amino acid transport system substrate-binding protein
LLEVGFSRNRLSRVGRFHPFLQIRCAYMRGLSRAPIVIGACLVFAITAFVVTTACQKKAPIRIGFLAGTSGKVADLGISGRDAAQMIVDICNREGGLKGRPVQLVVKDDQQDPEQARQAVKELIDAGVEALIGPMTSDMGLAVTPLLSEARLAAVSPTITTLKLSGLDDYFFRVAPTVRKTASQSADYHAQNTGIRRVAAIYDLNNRAYCENWLESFTANFTRQGGVIVKMVGFDTQSGATFLDLAKTLLDACPDGILIIANSMDAALICQQIRKIDKDLYITLADWGATERLLDLGGRAVEGVTVIQPFDRENKAPDFQAFRKAYRDRYHREPGFAGIGARDATHVVLTALKAKKKKEHLKDVILRLRKFDGLQGDLRFDDFGEIERSNATISVIRNHRFVVLE